ncbi:COG0789: Predicted transcriptional regulators [hydrothermal vent metagenome]|uniref:Mercuric resistance operon regulatory protein n=1 Tax=hydrothermal vent metagenome TaxID=652676 RepID=A0A3B0S7I5_9ZZZZ
MKNITIGKAAGLAGVGVETIRFYERKGMIAQPLKPRSGGFRQYSDEIVQRIRFIRQAQELGFSLREIRELLSLRADPRSDCSEVQRRANQKLAEVQGKMAQLRDMEAALKKVIGACPSSGGLDACSIISAMEARVPPPE